MEKATKLVRFGVCCAEEGILDGVLVTSRVAPPRFPSVHHLMEKRKGAKLWYSVKENAYTFTHMPKRTSSRPLAKPFLCLEWHRAQSRWKIPNYRTELNFIPHSVNLAKCMRDIHPPHQRKEVESVWEGGMEWEGKMSVTNCMLRNKFTQENGGWEVGEAYEYWNNQRRCCLLLFALLVFGTLSTFITLLHLVYSVFFNPPVSPPSSCSLIFPLLLSSTLREH